MMKSSNPLKLSGSGSSTKKGLRELPPLFYYMEVGDWTKALERIRRHPREAKTWATLRTKSTTDQPSTKRLALHHACFKLRAAGSSPFNESNPNEDEFIVVSRFILQLVRLYPEAAGQRESRHGCLPLHLAAFASCAPRKEDKSEAAWENGSAVSTSSVATASTATSASHVVGLSASKKDQTILSQKPSLIARRVASDASTETSVTAMTAMHAEEKFQGAVSDRKNQTGSHQNTTINPRVSVSSAAIDKIPPKREEVAVQVINALLDAFPKAIRVDSEGGRLVLHTACAGRATPRIVSTLITSYPSACRHRNKDGYLPLHLAAHWGVSHPSVAILLLKSYPDATLGRNRWERTPLEEALCMAGENGRPHQAALVRALRKHPSYWTRPIPESMQERSNSVTRPIDMDESIPSNDSTLEAEEERRRYGHEAFMLGILDENDEIELTDSNGTAEEPEAAPASLPSSPVSSGLSFFGRLSPSRKRNDEATELELGTPLSTLIHDRKWNTVMARLAANPLEAEKDLHILTRGGFMAVRGMFPLHYACERKPPVEVIHCLIEAHPLAVSVRAMPGGALPLHIACTWGASNDVVTALLSADSTTVKMTDELGNIALHSACFSGASVDVIQTLLEVYEKSTSVRNNQGSRPVDIARRLRHRNRNAVIDHLVRRKDNDASGAWSVGESAPAEANAELARGGARSPDIDFRASDALQDEQGGVEVTYEDADADACELLWI